MKKFFAKWNGSKFPRLCSLEDISGMLKNASGENFSAGNVPTAIDIVMLADKRRRRPAPLNENLSLSRYP